MFNQRDTSTKILKKNTHFRSWKKGKVWLYASATIIAMIGTGAVTSEVHADTTNGTPESSSVTSSSNISSSNAALSSNTPAVNKNIADSQAQSTVQKTQISASIDTAASSSAATSALSSSNTAFEESNAQNISLNSYANTSSSIAAQTAPTSGNSESKSSSKNVTTPTIASKDVVITKGDSFLPVSALVNATDSNGKTVGLDEITETGNVDTEMPGNYNVMYSFIDPETKQSVYTMARIIVSDDGEAAEESLNPSSSVERTNTQNDSNATSYTQGSAVSSSSVVNDSGANGLNADQKINSVSISSQVASKQSSGLPDLQTMATGVAKQLRSTADSFAALGQAASNSSVAASYASQATLMTSLASEFSGSNADGLVQKIRVAVKSLFAGPSGASLTAELKSISNMATTSGTVAPTDGSKTISLSSSEMSSYATEAVKKANDTAKSAQNDSSQLVNDILSRISAMETSAKEDGTFASSAAAFSELNSMATLWSAAVANPNSDTFTALQKELATIKQDATASSMAASITMASISLDSSDAASGTAAATTKYSVLNALAASVGPVIGLLVPAIATWNIVGPTFSSVAGFTTYVADLAGVIPAAWSVIAWPVIALDAYTQGILGIAMPYEAAGVTIATLFALAGGGVDQQVTGGIAQLLNRVGLKAVGQYFEPTVAGDTEYNNESSIVNLSAAIGTAIFGVIGGNLGGIFNAGITTFIPMVAGMIEYIVSIIPFVGSISTLIEGVITQVSEKWLNIPGIDIGAFVGGLIGSPIGALVGYALYSTGAIKQLGNWVNGLIGTIGINVGGLTAKVGSVLTKPITLSVGDSFIPQNGFVSAMDASGSQVPISKITTNGTVNTELPGTYLVDYQFVDSTNNQLVNAYSEVTVAN